MARFGCFMMKSGFLSKPLHSFLLIQPLLYGHFRLIQIFFTRRLSVATDWTYKSKTVCFLAKTGRGWSRDAVINNFSNEL